MAKLKTVWVQDETEGINRISNNIHIHTKGYIVTQTLGFLEGKTASLRGISKIYVSTCVCLLAIRKPLSVVFPRC